MKLLLSPETVYSVTTLGGTLLGVFTVAKSMDDVLQLETNTGRKLTVLLDQRGPFTAAFDDLAGRPVQAQVLRIDAALAAIATASAEPIPDPMTRERAVQLAMAVREGSASERVGDIPPAPWIIEAILQAAREAAAPHGEAA